jgi:hypothetical protein
VRQPAAAARTIHFDIGRITLHGYSPRQQTRFVSSLRARLAELAELAELAAAGGDGWPAAGQRRIGHLDAGLLRAGAPPEEAAERVAERLFAAVADGAGERRA